MQQKNKAIFPAIMTVAAFLCFLLAAYLLTDITISPRWELLVLFLIPTLVLLTLTILTRKGVIASMMGNVLTVVLSVLFFMVCAAGLFFLCFRAAAQPLTDVSLYQRVLEKHGYPDSALIAQFPPEIPEDAENAEFFYTPQVLQGAGVHRLSFALSDEAAQPLISGWEQAAIWHGPLSKLSSSPLSGYGAEYTVGQYVGADAEVWVILAAPYHPDSWNHGKLALAARSADGRTLVYSSDW